MNCYDMKAIMNRVLEVKEGKTKTIVSSLFFKNKILLEGKYLGFTNHFFWGSIVILPIIF